MDCKEASDQETSEDTFVITGLVDDECEPVYENLNEAQENKRSHETLNPSQIAVLETVYKRHKYLPEANVEEVGRMANLPSNSVRVWFKNRRQKDSKETLILEPKWLRKLESINPDPEPRPVLVNNVDMNQITVEILPEALNQLEKEAAVMNPGNNRSKLPENGLDEKVMSWGRGDRRLSYSSQQSSALEDLFQKNNYPDSETRDALAQQLGLPPQNVRFWFQNRRVKAKKQNGFKVGRKESKISMMMSNLKAARNDQIRSTPPPPRHLRIDLESYILQYPIPRYIE